MGSFGNICRLCCVEETSLIAIFNFFGFKTQLSERIKKYLTIEIRDDDDLPQCICNTCLSKLDELQEYVDHCQLAQRTLAEMHEQRIVARQRAEQREAEPQQEMSCEDLNSLVPALLLQEELSRRLKEQQHQHSVLTLPDPDVLLDNTKKRKRKKKPIKAVRKSSRRTNPANYSEDQEDRYNFSAVKSEPLDHDIFPNKEPHQVQDPKTTTAISSETPTTGELTGPEPENSASNFAATSRVESPSTGSALAAEGQTTEAAADAQVDMTTAESSAENKIGAEKDPSDALITAAPANDVGEEEEEPDITVDERIREPIVKIEEAGREEYDDDDDDEEDEEDEEVSDVSMEDERGSPYDSEGPSQSEITFAPLAHIARCSLCKTPFFALSSLLLHQRMVHAQESCPGTPLMCLFCSEKFKDLNLLTVHTSQRHADRLAGKYPVPRVREFPRRAREQKHRCAECNKAFPTKKGLTLHHAMHVRKRQRAAATTRFYKSKGKRGAKALRTSVRCSLCKAPASSLPQLRVHLSEMHPDDADHPTPYLCPLCDKTYGSPSSLVHHRAKHGVKSIKCPICDKSYHPKYLRKHMVVHQVDRPFKCDECDKTFKDVEGLRHHKLKHRPEDEKYTEACDICGQRFMNRGALGTHIKVVHNRIKEFGCSFCDRRFGSKATAEIHERIHTGEKPFCCEVCGWRCNSKGKLKVHMRVHSDVKPHECKTCGKRTRSKNEMRQHELIHTDIRPYPCKFCEKRFRSTSQLKIHVRQHTGERPYKCPHCTRSFCDFANYSKHMHRVHKKEFEVMQRSKMQYKGVPGKDLAAAGKMHLAATSQGDENSSSVGGAANATTEATTGAINPSSSCVSSATVSPVAGSSGAMSNNPVVAAASVNLQCLVEHSARGGGGIRSVGGGVPTGALELMTDLRMNSNNNQDGIAAANSYQTASALQLLRPASHNQHQQLLQQLHLQSQHHQQFQQQQHQQHLSDEPLNISQHGNLQQQQQQSHHHHHPQQQHHHKSQQQQLLEHLLPLSLPPPAHQHHLPHPVRQAHQNNSPSPSSMLTSLLPSTTSNSSSGAHSHHSSPGPSSAHHLPSPSSSSSSSHQHHQHPQSSLYPPQQSLPDQQQGQSGAGSGGLGSHLPPHMQSLQHHQHTLHQQYHPSFPGSHLANLQPGGAYDPFRLPL